MTHNSENLCSGINVPHKKNYLIHIKSGGLSFGPNSNANMLYLYYKSHFHKFICPFFFKWWIFKRVSLSFQYHSMSERGSCLAHGQYSCSQVFQCKVISLDSNF